MLRPLRSIFNRFWFICAPFSAPTRSKMSSGTPSKKTPNFGSRFFNFSSIWGPPREAKNLPKNLDGASRAPLFLAPETAGREHRSPDGPGTRFSSIFRVFPRFRNTSYAKATFSPWKPLPGHPRNGPSKSLASKGETPKNTAFFTRPPKTDFSQILATFKKM